MFLNVDIDIGLKSSKEGPLELLWEDVGYMVG